MKRLTEEAKLALEDILNSGDDERVHAREVLEEASKSDSPLHPYFTWEDSKAAELYRLREAKMLIKRVRITIVGDNSEPIRISAYTSQPSDRNNGGGYRATAKMLNDPEAKAEMLESLTDQLRGIQSTLKLWEDVPELEPLRAAVDHFIATQPAPKRLRRRRGAARAQA